MLRQPLTDGSWVEVEEVLLLGGRKLWSPIRFRTTEKCSGFDSGQNDQARQGP
jgi:hypothetical protein